MEGLSRFMSRLQPRTEPEPDAVPAPRTANPPADLDALRSAFLRLDLRLRFAVEALRDDIAARAADPLRGLYISDAEVDRLLEEMPPVEVAKRYLAKPIGAFAPRLARLARLFQLDGFEQEAVMVCLAPEVDLRYERLYGYLQDDVSRKRPTADLILKLLGNSEEERLAMRERLGARGRLFSSGILTLPDEAAERSPFLSRPIKLDDRITEYLVGADTLDARLAALATLHAVGSPPPFTPPDERVLAGLVRLLTEGNRVLGPQALGGPEGGVLLYVHGQGASFRKAVVRHACLQAQRPLLLVDLGELVEAHHPDRLLRLVVREALLQDAVLALDDLDALASSDDTAIQAAFVQLRRDLETRTGPTFFIGEHRWEPAGWLQGVPGLRVELPPLTLADRVRVWRSGFDGALDDDQLAELASRYRLDGDGVQAVSTTAQLHAQWRGAADADLTDVWAAARAVSAPPMEGLARRVVPRHTWNDIVLTSDGAAQLKELCGRARHALRVLEHWQFGRKHAGRAGLTALFAGPPGTGKTMGAEIVAAELGLELFRIDLAAIVSKYIGETEKNLDRIFGVAEKGDAVLLFDEADALFGKRSETRDAHDRYANVEIAYLLQRLETYDGVAILTTNLRGNLDEAFLRRLDFGIDFPMPEEAERLRIWQLSLPPAAPLADDVDLEFLARKFRLSGGHIRNIALAGAFLAAQSGGPIGMADLVRACRREYQKLGKLIREADFEKYYALLKE